MWAGRTEFLATHATSLGLYLSTGDWTRSLSGPDVCGGDVEIDDGMIMVFVTFSIPLRALLFAA